MRLKTLSANNLAKPLPDLLLGDLFSCGHTETPMGYTQIILTLKNGKWPKCPQEEKE